MNPQVIINKTETYPWFYSYVFSLFSPDHLVKIDDEWKPLPPLKVAGLDMFLKYEPYKIMLALHGNPIQNRFLRTWFSERTGLSLSKDRATYEYSSNGPKGKLLKEFILTLDMV